MLNTCPIFKPKKKVTSLLPLRFGSDLRYLVRSVPSLLTFTILFLFFRLRTFISFPLYFKLTKIEIKSNSDFKRKSLWNQKKSKAMTAIAVNQFAQSITCHAWGPDHSSTLLLLFLFLSFLLCLFPENFFFFLSGKIVTRLMDQVNFVVRGKVLVF